MNPDAWKHSAIAWTNADFWLVEFCAIHLIAISHEVPKLLFCNDIGNCTFKFTTTSPRGQWVNIKTSADIEGPNHQCLFDDKYGKQLMAKYP